MKVKLLKAHRHAGVNRVIGDIIEVDSDLAEWLANAKVATPVGNASTPKETPKAEAKSEVKIDAKVEVPKVVPSVDLKEVETVSATPVPSIETTTNTVKVEAVVRTSGTPPATQK